MNICIYIEYNYIYILKDRYYIRDIYIYTVYAYAKKVKLVVHLCFRAEIWSNPVTKSHPGSCLISTCLLFESLYCL